MFSALSVIRRRARHCGWMTCEMPLACGDSRHGTDLSEPHSRRPLWRAAFWPRASRRRRSGSRVAQCVEQAPATTREDLRSGRSRPARIARFLRGPGYRVSSGPGSGSGPASPWQCRVPALARASVRQLSTLVPVAPCVVESLNQGQDVLAELGKAAVENVGLVGRELYAVTVRRPSARTILRSLSAGTVVGPQTRCCSASKLRVREGSSFRECTGFGQLDRPGRAGRDTGEAYMPPSATGIGDGTPARPASPIARSARRTVARCLVRSSITVSEDSSTSAPRFPCPSSSVSGSFGH